MNYLALCQRLVQEIGISGGGPSAVTGQTGQLQQVVDWVQRAWLDIQLMRPNWNFMWEEFTFDTVVDQRDYLASAVSITDLSLWDTSSFLIYEKALDTNDQNEMLFKIYSRWRGEHRRGMTARLSDRPQNFTLLPNNKVRFEPKPDKVYQIDGEYKRVAQTFAADADVPTNLPDDFHLIIVWQALKYYASYEDAPEVMDEAEIHFSDLLYRLEQEQLPEFSDDFKALA